MKDFNTWLNESVLPSIQRATDILRERKDQKDLVKRIQAADPYRDKRFAPVIAGWMVKHDITPEEHKEDVVQFKELHRRLKDLRVPATNRERTARVKALLAKKPEDFAKHYSDLQDWNREASSILDPKKDLSDEGLPVEMRHGGYTMYRIDTEEQCEVPIVKNSMGWCVTKGSFESYGGPPYYPVVRDHDRSPFAMIIPNHFDRDPDQAVRNAQNDGRLSPADLAKIRPLVQHVLPLDKHKHRYIDGIHRGSQDRPELPENPSAGAAFHIIKDYALEPGEWPEGEEAVSKDPDTAVYYAREILRGPWPEAEKIISQDANAAYAYALFVIKGPWQPGEEAISKDVRRSYYYAARIVKGRWEKGEPTISQDPEQAYEYARYVLKGRFRLAEPGIIASGPSLARSYAEQVIKGPWPAGEEVISKDPAEAYNYAKDTLKGRFPAGEEIISQDAYHAFNYARHVIKGPWPKGEDAISQNARHAYHYAYVVVKGRFPLGEPAINKSSEYARLYARDVLKKQEIDP